MTTQSPASEQRRQPPLTGIVSLCVTLYVSGLLTSWVVDYAHRRHRAGQEQAGPVDACAEVRATCAEVRGDWLASRLCERLTVRAWEATGGPTPTLDHCAAASRALELYRTGGREALQDGRWKW